MNRNRASIFATALCAWMVVAGPAFAQDDPAPADEEKKVGFWGDRFALYVEAATGATSLGDLTPSLDTGLGTYSLNRLSFDDFKTARFTVGWTLPYDRGSFEVVADGYREDGFRLDAVGKLATLENNPSLTLVEPFDWWFVSVADGQIRSEQFPPTWSEGVDDANGNGTPDRDELVYDSVPAIANSSPAPESLHNTWQTYDVLYRRGFGGTRYGGRWSAGVRSFTYKGNLLVPAWVGTAVPVPGAGYTEGTALFPLTFSQDTTGVGPTASLGFVARFFRERVRLYAEGRLAFVISTAETDTGEFFTVLSGQPPNQDTLTTAPARLTKTIEKDVWHVTAEVGVEWTVAPGLSLRAEYYKAGYQDAIIVPTTLRIPTQYLQIPTGSGALFNTTDIRFDGWRAGLRFAF